MTPTAPDLSALVEGAYNFAIELNDEQLNQFALYQRLLSEWNNRINLTAIKDAREVQIRHFLDSLTCSLVTGDLNGMSLVDVGSGAGFPGIPLKIYYPRMRLTLLESVGKKADFLEMLSSELELKDVLVLNERAEVVGQDRRHRQQYDWAAARGVAEISVLLEYLLPLCKVGGKAIAQKGEGERDLSNSIAGALEILGGGPVETTRIQLPGHKQAHYLVVIPKTSPTPQKYPRRPGIPSKRPL